MTQSSTPTPPTTPMPVWEQRFRAIRISLPDWAEDAPERSLYLSNATGTFELYTWDRTTDERVQATERANGTSIGALTADGSELWWFADTDGDEFGIWMRQPFGAGPGSAQPAVEGLAPSYPAGLALGRGGRTVIARSDDDGTTIYAVTDETAPVPIYASEHDAHVGDLSCDTTLVCIEHSEHGDSRHMALRVLRLLGNGSTEPVADLYDGPGKGLDTLGFSPVDGDPRLLVRHERRAQPQLLMWNPVTGEQSEIELDLPGELSAEWYRDGAALLVEHEYAGRGELYRYDLATGELDRIDTPPGVVGSATTRPDGSVEYSWSSSSQPSEIRSTTGRIVIDRPGPPPAPSVPAEDVWTDGPGGRVHALLSRPPGAGPHPGVFLVHGGPTYHDSDSFAADVAAWVDSGYAVVRVNYRGSTGYGNAWRDSNEGRPGLTELEDLAAVHTEVVRMGALDRDRIALTGASWGGYLTLLGLGMQPSLWALGVASVPVADYVAAYADEMEPLKAFDRSLFGGSPSELPEVYEACSSITYVDAVSAPVFVLAGENDPRCPIRQIENYLLRLEKNGTPHEVYRYDAGHGSLVVDERVKQMRMELEFVNRHLSPS